MITNRTELESLRCRALIRFDRTWWARARACSFSIFFRLCEPDALLFTHLQPQILNKYISLHSNAVRA